jgi:hypothetical protein
MGHVEQLELTPVKPHQSPGRAQPKITVLSLDDRKNGIRRQAVLASPRPAIVL